MLRNLKPSRRHEQGYLLGSCILKKTVLNTGLFLSEVGAIGNAEQGRSGSDGGLLTRWSGCCVESGLQKVRAEADTLLMRLCSKLSGGNRSEDHEMWSDRVFGQILDYFQSRAKRWSEYEFRERAKEECKAFRLSNRKDSVAFSQDREALDGPGGWEERQVFQ